MSSTSHWRPRVGDPISVFGKERKIKEVNQGIRGSSGHIVGWWVWLDDGKKVFAKRTAGSPGKTYAAKVPVKRTMGPAPKYESGSFLDNPGGAYGYIENRSECGVCSRSVPADEEDDREGLCKKCFKYMDFEFVRHHGPVVETQKMQEYYFDHGQSLEGYRRTRLRTRETNWANCHGCGRLLSKSEDSAGRGYCAECRSRKNPASSSGSRFVTIKKSDIGENRFFAFGRYWRVDDWIGQIKIRDIGKRVFLRGGVLQVENDEQRNSRLARVNPGGIEALSWPATTTDFKGPFSKKNFMAYAKQMNDAGKSADVMCHGMRSIPGSLKDLPHGTYVLYGGTTDPNRYPAKWYATVTILSNGVKIT